MTIRYRQLTADLDYTFGAGPKEFLVDSAEAVLQAIETRLRLFQGEWFLDINEGTPWFTKILGENTQPFLDQAIKERILGTPGVATIEQYTSSIDKNTRKLSVRATVTVVKFPGVVKPTVGRLDIDFVLDFSLLG